MVRFIQHLVRIDRFVRINEEYACDGDSGLAEVDADFPQGER